ncbi:MAG: RNA-processing protein [Thermoprotei archaeon]|nr:MAG: RNA-processing protein [Thermoprotei archaeon]RLF09026.1 MAG: RNA-processing protein [Thermoprotei archaeon]
MADYYITKILIPLNQHRAVAEEKPILIVNIDPSRVGVLVGARGEIKRKLENAFRVKLKINSSKGEVLVYAVDKISPLNLLKLRNIIQAIGYGFSPEKAFLLANEDYMLDVIDLKEKAKHRADMKRIKARIIGEDGRARRNLEELTEAHISVGDRYIAILGTYEQVRLARQAIEMLIKGRMHATVYKYIKREKRKYMFHT